MEDFHELKTKIMDLKRGGVYLTPRDLQLITGHCYDHCRKVLKKMRIQMGLKRRYLTVFEYAKKTEIDLQLIIDCLNNGRK